MSFGQYAMRRAGHSIVTVAVVCVASIALAADAASLSGTEQLTPLALLGLLAVGAGKVAVQLWREWLAVKSGTPLAAGPGLSSDFLVRLQAHMQSEERHNAEVLSTIRDALRSHTDTMRELVRHEETVARRLEHLEHKVTSCAGEQADAIGALQRRISRIDEDGR